jgi:major vault protein
MSKDNNAVYRIPPYHYIHVLDQNQNVTRLEIGPKTFVKQDNEKVILGPEKMITIPPRNYCVIENPVQRNKDNAALFDESGQAKLAFADLEIRFNRDPFPLYPGEVLKQVHVKIKIKIH